MSNLFKFQEQQESTGGNKVFGLNKDCTLKSIEYKTTEKGEYLSLIFNVGGSDTYFSVFPISKIYYKREEIHKGHPKFEAEQEQAYKNLSEFFCTLMEVYIDREKVIELFNSGKIKDFKSLCAYTEKAIKSNKNWENEKIDLFLQWQRKFSPNQTMTFLEIPPFGINNIKNEKFICKAMEGDFKEDRTKTHLKYINEKGEEHIFKRGAYYLAEGNEYLEQQSLGKSHGSSAKAKSVEEDVFGSASTVDVKDEVEDDDLPF